MLAKKKLYLLFSSVFFFLISFLAVNSGCAEGGVRLTGGESEREGIVEVCHNQTWWTVSTTSWDIRDATVVCKHLHYPSNSKLTLKYNFRPHWHNACYLCEYLQGLFRCLMHTLEEAMPQ